MKVAAALQEDTLQGRKAIGSDHPYGWGFLMDNGRVEAMHPSVMAMKAHANKSRTEGVTLLINLLGSTSGFGVFTGAGVYPALGWCGV